MDICTKKYKRVRCEKWSIDVTLSATYRFHDKANPYAAVFQSAECPVVSNSKLPVHKRDTDYKWLMCNDYWLCPHLNSFPEYIEDTRVNEWDH